MTTGSRVDDYRKDVICYGIYIPYQGEAIVTPFQFGKKGTLRSKVWSGSDAAPKPSSVLQKYWEAVDRGSDVKGNLPRTTYLERWLEKRNTRRAQQASRGDHPYSCTVTYSHDEPYVLHYSDPYGNEGWTFSTFVRDYGEGFSFPQESVWSSDDDLKLISKLRERVVGSDFNAGVFLGESKKALDLITETAVRIRKAAVALRKGDISAIRKYLADPVPISIKDQASRRKYENALDNIKIGRARDLASEWLKLQYGWLPLIQDMSGGAQALAQQLNNPAVARYVARRTRRYDLAPTSPNIVNGAYFFAGGSTSGQIIARLTEVNVAQLNGLVDPAEVAWELTPFSFVADWFIPIGTYLAARNLRNSVTGSYTKTIVKRTAFFCKRLDLGGGYTSAVLQPDYKSFTIDLVRTVGLELDVPLPQFKPLSKVLSYNRAVNAIALLTQTLLTFKK